MDERKQDDIILRCAYFTVEAAFILPLTMGVIVLLIYLMFYQYDRCLFEQDMGIAAMRASILQTEDNRAKLEELNRQADRIYLDKYVAFQPEAIVGRIQLGKVEASRKAAVMVPFPNISAWTGRDSWSMETCFSNRSITPTWFIRACRKIRSLGAGENEQDS